MISIQFEHKGKEYCLEIPVTPDEVSIGQYYDFKNLHRKYLASEADVTVQAMANCLQPIFGDAVLFLDYYDENQGIEEGKELTLQALYKHFVEVCTYEVTDKSFIENQDFEVEINGESYYLLGDSTLRLAGIPTGDKISVYEEIEGKMAEVKFKELLDGGEYDETDLAFSFDASLAAILLRKKDELLPLAPAELDKFIAERTAFFAEHLSLGIAKDLLFFFAKKQEQLIAMTRSALLSTDINLPFQPNREQRRRILKDSKIAKRGRSSSNNMQTGEVRTLKA
jgi:hypothetical protein